MMMLLRRRSSFFKEEGVRIDRTSDEIQRQFEGREVKLKTLDELLNWRLIDLLGILKLLHSISQQSLSFHSKRLFTTFSLRHSHEWLHQLIIIKASHSAKLPIIHCSNIQLNIDKLLDSQTLRSFSRYVWMNLVSLFLLTDKSPQIFRFSSPLALMLHPSP
jgi:hypothetical protein